MFLWILKNMLSLSITIVSCHHRVCCFDCLLLVIWRGALFASDIPELDPHEEEQIDVDGDDDDVFMDTSEQEVPLTLPMENTRSQSLSSLSKQAKTDEHKSSKKVGQK